MTVSRKAQRLITVLFLTLTSSNYRRMQRSGLFIADLYLRHNPDVAALGTDPLAHYLQKGYRELRQLGPLFDVSFYLSQAPELKNGQINPLLDFLEKGYLRDLLPNPFCDTPFYQTRHQDFDSSSDNLLSHFLRHGYTANQSASPSPYFDPIYYCRQYSDARSLGNRPDQAYLHFLIHGLKEGRQPSATFDPEWYLDKTPILREMGFDAFTHYLYLKIGISERKSPSPLFDPHHYQQFCSLPENHDLYAHYLRQGEANNFPPCSWFDPNFYRQTYLQQDPTPPLQHFLESGLKKGLYANGEIAALPLKPRFSVVLPIYNTNPAHLNTCIRSVLFQSYPHWQLCLADDCSSDPAIRPLVNRWCTEDPRISAVFLEKNSGISAATNAAAGQADGDYLLFLDHDDELAPEAMATFATAINHHSADLYYSDEDLIGADGRQFSIFRKPAFNRELLLCHNYITHCVVAKRSLFEEVGGCDSTYDGAQDLDLFLKLSERANQVVHIPEILYHWRASETSTSINHQEKHYADEAGRNCVAAALKRWGIAGEVLGCEWKFFYRAKRALPAEDTVTLVLDWRRRQAQDCDPQLISKTAGYAIAKTIVLVDQGQSEKITGGAPTLDCIESPREQSTAAIFTSLLGEIGSHYLVWLDGNQQPEAPHWLAALIEYGQDRQVAMVRGHQDYEPQDHPAITPIADTTQTSPLYFIRFLADCSILMNGSQCPQEVMAACGGIMLFRNDLLRARPELFSGDFPEICFFLSLTMGLQRLGAKNIYTPYCRSRQAMPAETGDLLTASPLTATEELRNFQRRWGKELASNIPFYNPGIINDAKHSTEKFHHWLTGDYQ